MSRNTAQNAALDWAEGEPSSGDGSLWARFDYLKLRETLEAIVAAMEETAQVDAPSEPEADGVLRLVVSNDQPKRDDASPSD